MNIRTQFRRLVLGAGLALTVLAPAALGGVAQAAAPPTLSVPQIKAAGTSAVVTLTTSEPAAIRVDYRPASPANVPGGQSAGTSTYATAHELKLTGLTSNTGYAVTITARALDGRTATAATSFTTLKKRIRVTLESIDIKDDGDGILTGDGEPAWVVLLAWASGVSEVPESAYCYPLDCKYGKYGEGRFSPSNSAGESLKFTFAEENFDRFPDRIMLRAEADEQDTNLVDDWAVRIWECVFGVVKGGCIIGDETATEWRVPRGAEFDSAILAVNGHDPVNGFESVLNFSVVLYHDAAPYPVRRNGPSSNWR